MANLWVGTDYYIPSIDQSGSSFDISINSTTTSNTFIYSTGKNQIQANLESVGAAAIVFLPDPPFGNCYFNTSSDDSRRTTITPSSTTSKNGTGLQVEYAIAANGFLKYNFPVHFDTKVSNANTVPYHVTAGGTGWEELDNVTFANISAGFPNGATEEQFHTVVGEVVWTDKNGPYMGVGTSEIGLASNATHYVNAMIRTGSWTP